MLKEIKNMISLRTEDGTQRSKRSCRLYGLRPIWCLKNTRLWLRISQVSSCILTYQTNKVSEKLQNLRHAKESGTLSSRLVKHGGFRYGPAHFCLSKAHGMYPFPHATQHLFFIQPIERFSSEQTSWYVHFLIHTVLILKKDSWILEAVSSCKWGVCYGTGCLSNNIKPFSEFVSSLCSLVLFMSAVSPHLNWRSIKHYEFIPWNSKV